MDKSAALTIVGDDQNQPAATQRGTSASASAPRNTKSGNSSPEVAAKDNSNAVEIVHRAKQELIKLPTTQGVVLTRKGLTITGSLTELQWEGMAQGFRALDTTMRWALADWVAYAETSLDKEAGKAERASRYKRAGELTGLDPGYLRNLAVVARAVDMSRRRDDLSFGHHAEVAPLDGDKQVKWLERAASEHLSTKALRERTATDKKIASPGGPSKKTERDQSVAKATPSPESGEQMPTEAGLPESILMLPDDSSESNDPDDWQDSTAAYEVDRNQNSSVSLAISVHEYDLLIELAEYRKLPVPRYISALIRKLHQNMLIEAGTAKDIADVALAQ